MARCHSITLSLLLIFFCFSAQGQEAYLGEVRCVAITFTPRGFAKADGQLLDISQNSALFSLLGKFPSTKTFYHNGTSSPLNYSKFLELVFSSRSSYQSPGPWQHLQTLPRYLKSLGFHQILYAKNSFSKNLLV